MSATVKNNFQEYDPRHRLTGAVVLILLAIILLPMLLSKEQDAEPPEAEPAVMEVTIGSKKVFVSRISSATREESSGDNEGQKITSSSKADNEASTTSSSVKKSEKATGKSKQTSKDESKEEVEETSALFRPMTPAAGNKSSATKAETSDKKTGEVSDTKKSSKAPAAKTSPSKATTKKTTTAKKSSSAAASGAWILQVGVFSQSANASKKVAELKKKGFNAKTSKLKTSKGTVTKVWLGPFKDRPSAEKMQDRLQHKTRQRGMVVKN